MSEHDRARYWYRVRPNYGDAVRMADRHYSRKRPGTPQFTPPGNKVVLVQVDACGRMQALWASHRPDPTAGVPRMDGLDAWACSLFRVEHRTVPASVLIREAVAITLAEWGGVPPADGFVTTVDPRFVTPIRRRGQEVWGYCYIKAGWQVMPQRTKDRGLILLQLPLVDLLRVAPCGVSWYAPLLAHWEAEAVL